MPSITLHWWHSVAALELDEVEGAHAAIGGTGRGRRYATGQINNAYAVLLSSQFQRFCRDLHTEAAAHLASVVPPSIRAILQSALTVGRKLDAGNPNAGNIGSDYDRLGLRFWQQPDWARPINVGRRRNLGEWNIWRSAIAHQDFTHAALAGRRGVTLG